MNKDCLKYQEKINNTKHNNNMPSKEKKELPSRHNKKKEQTCNKTKQKVRKDCPKATKKQPTPFTITTGQAKKKKEIPY